MDRYAQTQMWGILKSWFWGKNKSLITLGTPSYDGLRFTRFTKFLHTPFRLPNFFHLKEVRIQLGDSLPVCLNVVIFPVQSYPLLLRENCPDCLQSHSKCLELLVIWILNEDEDERREECASCEILHRYPSMLCLSHPNPKNTHDTITTRTKFFFISVISLNTNI